MRTLSAYTDGASRGNPGESGIGVIIRDDAGVVLYTDARYIGTATNNVAEYTALIACLRKALELGCERLTVHSDSELMVRQLQGVYKVRENGLQALYRMVRQLLKDAPFTFSIVHIARELNREADRLANQGIDERRNVQV